MTATGLPESAATPQRAMNARSADGLANVAASNAGSGGRSAIGDGLRHRPRRRRPDRGPPVAGAGALARRPPAETGRACRRGAAGERGDQTLLALLVIRRHRRPRVSPSAASARAVAGPTAAMRAAASPAQAPISARATAGEPDRGRAGQHHPAVRRRGGDGAIERLPARRRRDGDGRVSDRRGAGVAQRREQRRGLVGGPRDEHRAGRRAERAWRRRGSRFDDSVRSSCAAEISVRFLVGSRVHALRAAAARDRGGRGRARMQDRAHADADRHHRHRRAQGAVQGGAGDHAAPSTSAVSCSASTSNPTRDAVHLRFTAAPGVLDEEHADPAGHDLHRRRTGASPASSRTPSRRPSRAREVPAPSQYVLEIGGGLSARYGIRAGQAVDFQAGGGGK